MDSGLKQRLIGAAVLVALAVIFLPMLVQGPAPDSGVSDVPLTMPEAPQGDYETRDLPLVTPGAAPDGGAVGLQTEANDNDALPTVDAGSAQAPASQAVPLGDSGVSAPTALPAEPTPTPAPAPTVTPAKPQAPTVTTAKPQALPVATAGGDYAVHFGSYATAANAETIIRQLRGSQLPGYSEATTLNGKPAWRVRIGPYASRADAEAARLRAAQVRDDVSARVVALDAEAASAQVAAKPSASSITTQPLPPDTTKPATVPPAASKPAAAPMPLHCAIACAAPVSARSPKPSTPTRAR
jgi:cell division septation protein DedD